MGAWNLPPSEFWDMTPLDFWLVHDGRVRAADAQRNAGYKAPGKTRMTRDEYDTLKANARSHGIEV